MTLSMMALVMGTDTVATTGTNTMQVMAMVVDTVMVLMLLMHTCMAASITAHMVVRRVASIMIAQLMDTIAAAMTIVVGTVMGVMLFMHTCRAASVAAHMVVGSAVPIMIAQPMDTIAAVTEGFASMATSRALMVVKDTIAALKERCTSRSFSDWCQEYMHDGDRISMAEMFVGSHVVQSFFLRILMDHSCLHIANSMEVVLLSNSME
jgi:hypothetical protein